MQISYWAIYKIESFLCSSEMPILFRNMIAKSIVYLLISFFIYLRWRKTSQTRQTVFRANKFKHIPEGNIDLE